MEFSFKKMGYGIPTCPKCNLAMTDFHKPYEKFIKNFYAEGYFSGDPSCGAYAQYEQDKRFIIKNMAPLMTVIRKYKKKGRLFDVGCAMGYFVELSLKAGFDAYGIDPSKFAISHAPKYLNGRLTLGSIKEANFPDNNFDVITLFDVLEHLQDPVSSLKQIGKLLKPDGIAVIATGNKDSFAARAMGSRWTFYNPPQHLLYFNKNNLTTILKKANLVGFKWFSLGKWLSLGYVLHLAYSASGMGIAKPLFKIVQRWGMESIPLYVPLGDNMAVVVKKKET
jgi:SAM-dependent methyltransferase